MSSASFSPTIGADELAHLGEALATDGLADQELAVRRFVAAARQAGLSSPSLDVLADSSFSEPLRLRAFGHAAVQYGWRATPPSTPRQRAA